MRCGAREGGGCGVQDPSWTGRFPGRAQGRNGDGWPLQLPPAGSWRPSAVAAPSRPPPPTSHPGAVHQGGRGDASSDCVPAPRRLRGTGGRGRKLRVHKALVSGNQRESGGEPPVGERAGACGCRSGRGTHPRAGGGGQSREAKRIGSGPTSQHRAQGRASAARRAGRHLSAFLNARWKQGTPHPGVQGAGGPVRAAALTSV